MNKRLLFVLLGIVCAWGIQAQYTSVGIIGEATPNNNWDNEVFMTQDADSAHLWTLDVTLSTSIMKFRADTSWAVNWGDVAFPYGTGTQGGANINTVAGDYHIEFNSNTGVYYFENLNSNVGIIGTATAFGWDRDVNMIPDTSGDTNKFFLKTYLSEGEVKFRANDAWDLAWGSDMWPSGTADATGGSPNMPCPQASPYLITFDTSTLEYNFERMAAYDYISLIGEGTDSMSWEADVDLVQDGNTPALWSAIVNLHDGPIKFRANHDWAENWGGTDFPSGTGVLASSDNIPATAGRYLATFNTETLEYSFVEVGNYSSISLIGQGTEFQDWDTDVPLTQDPNNEAMWTGRVILNDGPIKFRADNDWAVSWGAGDWPSGTASSVVGAPNIPALAGEYKVQFNTVSGAYNFEELIIFDTIGLIGTASPNQNWEDDVIMTRDANDEQLFKLNSVMLFESTSEDCSGEYGVKFRADRAWDTNWGLCEFPSGIGVQNGQNIPITETKLYGVVFNTATGEYVFGEPFVNTIEVLNPSDVVLFPNPSADHIVRLNSDDARLFGEVKIEVYDMAGKLLLSQAMHNYGQLEINIGSLQAGTYLLNLINDQFIVGKKLNVIR